MGFIQWEGRLDKDWVLRDVKTRLKRWLFIVLKIGCAGAERRLRWQEAIQYLCREVSGWNHTPEAVEQLRGFISVVRSDTDQVLDAAL
jgi:hypothetical protein